MNSENGSLLVYVIKTFSPNIRSTIFFLRIITNFVGCLNRMWFSTRNILVFIPLPIFSSIQACSKKKVIKSKTAANKSPFFICLLFFYYHFDLQLLYFKLSEFRVVSKKYIFRIIVNKNWMFYFLLYVIYSLSIQWESIGFGCNQLCLSFLPDKGN